MTAGVVMLHYQGLAETADRLASGDLRAVVLTEALLDRIARLDPQLQAFVTVTADRALDMARRADEARANGMRLGPMHGVPIAVKDLFDIAGVANTAGMPIRSRAIATRTATVIRRLEAAGAVLEVFAAQGFDHAKAIGRMQARGAHCLTVEI